MSSFVLAPSAERDIESILTWTHLHFGEQARMRYEALLNRSIDDVATCPELLGSMDRPEIASGVRTYRLTLSRRHVDIKAGHVQKPRHFLLYRTRADGVVEVARVLHDSMDLDRHLPDDYHGQSK